ncbi:unnamed protein product [Miscanthus lutarioriparius]|uniref:Uncharacterized protein n=1 Tax=Miscanthus lutarioriparius TaxID=422564 RepID=A0A811SI32_9POAL|nr:unnamed protein product [Miscanthus lutarioriparius]
MAGRPRLGAGSHGSLALLVAPDRPHGCKGVISMSLILWTEKRIRDLRQEFQTIIKDPLMANSIIFGIRKQTGSERPKRGALDEVSEGLGLHDLRNRIWHIQGTCALRGEGAYSAQTRLAWSTLKQLQESGHATSVAGPPI